MISIYRAANPADAHLIRHLLAQARIPAYVAGEYLQGALGEIPADTPIDVRVAPEHAPRARRIVEDWCNSPVDDAMFDDATFADADAPEGAPDDGRTAPPAGDARVRALLAIAWLLAGAALAACVVWAAQHGPRRDVGTGDGAFERRGRVVEGRRGGPVPFARAVERRV